MDQTFLLRHKTISEQIILQHLQMTKEISICLLRKLICKDKILMERLMYRTAEKSTQAKEEFQFQVLGAENYT